MVFNSQKRVRKFKNEKIIEIGSGGGFLKEVMPNVTTSDILQLPDNDLTFDALNMPFENSSIGAFVMVDAFHHIPDSEKFLAEMERTLISGGKIIMNEPWNSFWGRLIYKNFHHETFNPKGDWKIPSSGPMSDANGALPWIVFNRDIEIFERKYPNLRIKKVTPHTPLRYLLSGGVSMKTLVPQFSFGLFKNLELLLRPLKGIFSMFVVIVIEKK